MPSAFPRGHWRCRLLGVACGGSRVASERTDTEGYRRIQKDTEGYRKIQKDTEGYNKNHKDTEGSLLAERYTPWQTGSQRERLLPSSRCRHSSSGSISWPLGPSARCSRPFSWACSASTPSIGT